MPDKPIASSPAWLGADQTDSGDWRYELTPDDVAELVAAAERAKSNGLGLEQIGLHNFALPRLGPTLKSFSHDLLDGRGFVLLRGFPVAGRSVEDISRMYFGASLYLGLPIAQNSKNSMIGNVRNEGLPYGGKVRGYQSNAELFYHNDAPDVVGLCCIKQAKMGGVSRIVSAVSVHNTIMVERPDLLFSLYQDPYYFSWMHEGPVDGPPFYWSRIFSWYEGRLDTRWVYSVVRATQAEFPEAPRFTAAQSEAVEFMNEVANRAELCLDMDFAPGDVQYLNNATILHTRTAFEDYDDRAERRHLLRIWLNRYSQSAMPPSFTDRYDQLGDARSSPRRRLFPVELHDTW